MKVVMTADWHVDSTAIGGWDSESGMHSNWVEALKRVSDIVDETNRIGAELLVVSGDIWSTGRPSAESVGLVMDSLDRLHKNASVVIATGNHDQKTVVGDHRTPIDVYLSGHSKVKCVAAEPTIYDHHGVQIGLLPWIRVAGASGETRARKVLSDTVKEFADKMSGPCLLAGHLTLSECSFSSDRRGSELSMITDTLEAEIAASELDAGPWDFALLGHVHKRQMVTDKTGYTGSPYRVTYGEKEDKGFDVLTLDGSRFTRQEIVLDGRRLHTVDLTASRVTTSKIEQMVSSGDYVKFIFDGDSPDNLDALSDRASVLGAHVERRRKPKVRQAVSRIAGVERMSDKEALEAYMKHVKVDGDVAEEAMRIFSSLEEV